MAEMAGFIEVLLMKRSIEHPRTRPVQRVVQQNARSRAPKKAPKRAQKGRLPGKSATSKADAPELAPTGPAGLSSLHPFQPGRDVAGRFVRENLGHLQHGAHSTRKFRELAPVLRAQKLAIIEAKGFTEADVDPVFARVVDGFVQSAVMLDSFFEFLATSGGPISAKGRTRRALEGWSKAADRVAKLGAMLGLERKPRRVKQTLSEWLQQPQPRGAMTETDQANETHKIGETIQTSREEGHAE